MADLGKVKITDGGNYSANVTYEELTFVHYQGDAYMTLKTVKGITPADDGTNYKLFCKSAELATASKAGIVLPDSSTTTVDSSGKMSVKKATTSAAGIVKPAATDFTVSSDGTQKINTQFTQASELANIIAGEAIATVLGKISKAIATTMNLDQNALLKNMISNIDVNDQNKINSAAYIHTLVQRIGMGNTLQIGNDLTDAANKLNTAVTQLNGDWFTIRAIKKSIASGYIMISDTRIKNNTKCVCTQEYISEIATIPYNIITQVQNGSVIIYVRKPDATIPDDGSLISVDVVFSNTP